MKTPERLPLTVDILQRSASKIGSDSHSMNFAGDFAILQMGDQRHADWISNFVLVPSRLVVENVSDSSDSISWPSVQKH
jgi:hypothetical protein